MTSVAVILEPAGWRRRVEARAITGSDVPEVPGKPNVVWLLTGPQKHENLARILRCEVCWHCLTPFPAPPRPDNRRMFIGLDFGRPDRETLQCVSERRCPMPFCGVEVTPEIAARILVQDRWNDRTGATESGPEHRHQARKAKARKKKARRS